MPINPAVTDPVVLSYLNAHSVNSSDVTFTEDYAHRGLGKGHSPYAKFYSHSDRKTKYMVSSGLPMIDNSGDPLTPGWSLSGTGVYISQKNLMTANIQGNAVELVVRNADPVGRAAGATLGFTPRVTVGGVVVTPSAPTLLATDPDNSGFNENVLEWNYGTFTRRLRQVQGRVRGKWIFPANPGGDVRITYNQTGDYRLQLGEYAANADEEFVPESVFLDAGTEYPFTVGDSTTFYPDAHTESTSVDGSTRRYDFATGFAWADVRDGAGTHSYDSGDELDVYIQAHGTTNYWKQIRRLAVLFDTSGIGAGADVTGATLSLYGARAESTDIPLTGNIYTSAPASNTALVNADYGTFGATALSTGIAEGSFSTSGYNDFALNSTGLDAVSVDGVTKLGFRDQDYDVANSMPAWDWNHIGGIGFWAAEKGGAYRPKLVVTHEAPVASSGGFFGMM